MKRNRSQRLLVFLGITVVLLTMAAQPVLSSGTDAATEKPDWFFHDIVDASFVQQYAKMPQPENVMIIDARPKKAKYDNGYIPTAVSIPDSQFDKMTAKLPENKDTLLIFYCEGPT